MRIIAGTLKGKQFASPHSNNTHPTSDKIKGALFNALGELEGMTVLDAFSGTGAFCFESISRGATRAVAIESDKQAQRAIGENITTLGLETKVEFYRGTISSWLPRTKELFDVVLMDPPFTDLRRDIMLDVALRTKPGGVVVLSIPTAAAQIVVLSEPFTLLSQKTYGNATLAFYRRSQ